MRLSWLALSALLLLVAPGCGDDTASGTDMAVTMDMAMAIGDMAKATCMSQISCGSMCISAPKKDETLLQCGMRCAAPLSGAAQQAFGALEQCIFSCVTDAGVDTNCALSATQPGGMCYAKLAACSAL